MNSTVQSLHPTLTARLDQHRDRGVDGEGGGEDEDDDGVVGPGAA